MRVHVNLLPGAYRQVRQHHHRYRVGIMIWLVLLVGEVTAGLLLNARANYTRELFTAAEAAREAAISTKKTLDEPSELAAQLGKQVELAEKLRTKHRWSRLLGAIARATPERVVIAAVSTDPPQWNPGARASALPTVTVTGVKIEQPPLLMGINITGHAVDHSDLSAFITAVHASGLFAAMDLKQARREKFMDHDAILFELNCRW